MVNLIFRFFAAVSHIPQFVHSPAGFVTLRFFFVTRKTYLCGCFRYGVALYYPPGNFPNQYAENVQPRSDLEDFRLA
jgi:hypothetical protein